MSELDKSFYVNGDIILYHNKSNNGKSEYAAYYKNEQNPMSNIIVFDKIDGFKYSYCDKEDIVGRVLYARVLLNSTDAALLCIYDHFKKGKSINDLLYGYSSPEEYIKEGLSIRDRIYLLT